MEWLSGVLKEYIAEDKLETALSEVKKVFPEYAVPKEQYNKKAEALEVASSELETAKTQMEEVNTKLSELSASGEELETVKAQLTEQLELNKKIESESEERIASIELSHKRDTALERALINAKADPTQLDWLKSEFAPDSLNLTDDGSIVGFDDLLKGVKEKRPNSFIVETVTDPNGEPEAGNPTNTSVSSFSAGLNSVL